jgi:hypothetical protein
MMGSMDQSLGRAGIFLLLIKHIKISVPLILIPVIIMRSIKVAIVTLGKGLRAIRTVIILLLKSGKFGSFSSIEHTRYFLHFIYFIHNN